MTISNVLPPVNDEAEAETLMFHHLALAAQYFEMTGASHTIPSTFSSPAMKVWIAAMEALYQEV